MTILETERLTICHLTLADAPFILDLLNEPSFIQFIGDRKVCSPDDAQIYLLNGPIKSYQQNGFGLFLTKLKVGNVPIGICGLIKRDGLDDVDVGYAFLPHYWGKGFATEAVTAVIHYGFTTLKLDRIVAITSPDNIASIRVLEKSGLTFVKTITLPGYKGKSKLFSLDLADR